jgi:hypothetical protein
VSSILVFVDTSMINNNRPRNMVISCSCIFENNSTFVMSTHTQQFSIEKSLLYQQIFNEIKKTWQITIGYNKKNGRHNLNF